MQRLFEHILELADDEDSLVCVLVDEVFAEILPQRCSKNAWYTIPYHRSVPKQK